MEARPRAGGWIEVICGSMFSGKTEELLRRLRRAQIAHLRVQIFKPALDDRYAAEEVVSHDRRTLPAFVVREVSEIEANLDPLVQVLAIDEAQFFDERIVGFCERVADSGTRVIVAGLDMDYLGRPFGPMPLLMAVAEFVTKNHAICVCCGGPASRSCRMSGGEALIEVGAAGSYEARCRSCANLPVAACPLPRHESLIGLPRKAAEGLMAG